MHPRTQPIYIPSSGMPQAAPPSREIFGCMGQAGIFGLLAELYQELEASSVRHLFPADMQAASERSAAFFVQLLGGPPLFSERFGPPRMRARHIPFEIDDAARDTWLACFQRVLEKAPERHGFPPEHLDGFQAFLHSFSAWMVNVGPPAQG